MIVVYSNQNVIKGTSLSKKSSKFIMQIFCTFSLVYSFSPFSQLLTLGMSYPVYNLYVISESFTSYISERLNAHHIHIAAVKYNII